MSPHPRPSAGCAGGSSWGCTVCWSFSEAGTCGKAEGRRPASGLKAPAALPKFPKEWRTQLLASSLLLKTCSVSTSFEKCLLQSLPPIQNEPGNAEGQGEVYRSAHLFWTFWMWSLENRRERYRKDIVELTDPMLPPCCGGAQRSFPTGFQPFLKGAGDLISQQQMLIVTKRGGEPYLSDLHSPFRISKMNSF